MAWEFDLPSGTFKNHFLSNKLRMAAIANTVFMRFLPREPGFGRGQGESATITRILNLPEAARIGETDDIPSGRPQVTTKQVSVSRWGFKIPITDYERHLSKFDLLDPFQATLRRQMELTFDTMSADALKKTPIKYVPTSSGFTLTTNGAAGATADRNLMVRDIREIKDYLAGTLQCPPFANRRYVGILSTRAARGILNDPEFKDWIAPTSSEPFINGQIGTIEDVTLITTNHTNALADLVGSSVTTGEAIFFGADAAALLEVQPPELRLAGNAEKLGTEWFVGWVGILEAFLVWEQASLARVVHVTSQ